MFSFLFNTVAIVDLDLSGFQQNGAKNSPAPDFNGEGQKTRTLIRRSQGECGNDLIDYHVQMLRRTYGSVEYEGCGISVISCNS